MQWEFLQALIFMELTISHDSNFEWVLVFAFWVSDMTSIAKIQRFAHTVQYNYAWVHKF